MNIQNTAALHSTAPRSSKAEEMHAGSTSNPVYVRASSRAPVAQDINPVKSRNLATDGAGRASFPNAESLSDLKDRARMAAEQLQHMLPGDAIDLGRLEPSAAAVSGYLCRRTAQGDGYVVQSHEQAKSAPLSGMFFPAADSNAEITMDRVPVTDVNQLPPHMYNILYVLYRFVHRQPLSQLLMSNPAAQPGCRPGYTPTERRSGCQIM